MSTDVIWALDQRERCIVAPSKPKANAVILHLGADGGLKRDACEIWARAGVMAAGATWPGSADLTHDDWLDLEDAALGLADLASFCAIVGERGMQEVVADLGARTGLPYYLGEAGDTAVLNALTSAAPVA